MAKDAIALLDHLGWTKAHVFGHSMGESTIDKLQLCLGSFCQITHYALELLSILSPIPSYANFSMNTGAMIATKVAAMVPERVLSLALLNVTGGGFECFPKVSFFCTFFSPNGWESFQNRFTHNIHHQFINKTWMLLYISVYLQYVIFSYKLDMTILPLECNIFI